MNTIGIVGQGFVGTAVREGMKHAYHVHTYDKFKEDLSTTASIAELVGECDIIFVCVPTPMHKNGACDISIVESVIKDINEYATENTIAVVKSTVPPGTTEYLDNAFKNVRVVFNPEFLKEATPIEDFKNQNRIILGGDFDSMTKVGNLYKKAYPHVPVIGMESMAAEMVKYTTNCFLATKVSFFNEIYQICEKMDIPYDGVIRAAQFDNRLGTSHMQVPGPDGSFGFGLSCFPKDLNALTFVAKMVGIKPTMLESTWKKNLEVRKPEDRDWEKMSKAVVGA